MQDTPLKKEKKLGFCLLNAGLVLALFLLLFIFVRTGVVNAYYSYILTNVCINVALAVSLNIVTGFLGQLVLGHAGFMLVGALLIIPVILGYTCWSYYVFRGKVQPGEGYH